MNQSLSRRSKVIAIDGPSGSGKSTVARAVSDRLHILYVDTGAMFRALAYAFDRAQISHLEAKNQPALTQKFLKELKFDYAPNEAGAKVLIRLNGEDLTSKIREHHISALASLYSQIPTVRSFLLLFQRELAMERFCVMEGRDIGTVVFPDSFCKIFLTADLSTRANRRLMELAAKSEKNLSLAQVCEDLEKRDLADSSREYAPLIQAGDAFLLDTSNLKQDEVLDKIVLQVNSCLQKWKMSIS